MVENNVVEVLHTDVCPFWEETLKIVAELIKELNLTATVRKIKIMNEEEAKRYRFPGSPTVRINGVDVDPSTRKAEGFVGCRIYRYKGKTYDSPPKEMIVSAFKRLIKK